MMTKLLDQALEIVRRLPEEWQDDIAPAILVLARGDSELPEAIDPAHLADVLTSWAQACNRQFATDDEIAAAFRRFET
jgi:hypothetical protein